MQYRVRNSLIGIPHIEIVYVISVRRRTVQNESALGAAACNLRFYIVRRSVGDFYMIPRKGLRKIFLYGFRKGFVFGIHKHYGKILWRRCPGLKSRDNIRNKHGNSDCDYKKYRDACKDFVFEIAFQLEFKYFSKLFHRSASLHLRACVLYEYIVERRLKHFHFVDIIGFHKTFHHRLLFFGACKLNKKRAVLTPGASLA